MTTGEVIRRLDAKPTAKPDAWIARCPAHEDGTASLSVSAGVDGRTLLHCHAGCTLDAIVGAMGLAAADLFAAAIKTRTPKIVATHDYLDETGKLLFQCVRFDPKTFRQRRPDSALPDKWHWNLNGVQRVLYRLPEIVKGVKAGRTIFVPEGEKDCDALALVGFVATCNPMGAGKWLPEHAETLRGAARAVVIADKDTPGRQHANAVAQSLVGVAKCVKLLELPDRADKAVKDSSDWFAAGGTAGELKDIVDAAPEFVPAPEPAKPKSKPGGLAAEYLGDEGDEQEPEEEEDPTFALPAWPAPPRPEAFYGLAGEVVSVIDRHSESDQSAVLAMFLSAFGNMAGPSAHFMAEARQHPARVWPVLVGETAKGRKGAAWSCTRHVLGHLDPQWLDRCTASGLSSGEGLIFAIRDPVVRRKKGKDGIVEEVVEDEGVADKRLLTVEEELSAVLKAASREGNTVSDLLRRAWDDGNLRTLTKNSPARATGAHVTVIGHITKPDLSRLLSETDGLNGFGNRFLWLAVRRSKLLPEGGALNTENLAPLVLRLRRALDFARKTTLTKRSEAARKLWREVYPSLTGERFGISGALTNRAEAQVMRLALVYALLDCSAEIDVPHLQAALALWDFCDRCTRFIFGESLGDRVSDRVLDELRCAGSRGLTRNDLRELFHRNLPSSKLDPALATLYRLGLAAWSKEPRTGAAGRPAVVWRATRRPDTVRVAGPAPAAAAAQPSPHIEYPQAKETVQAEAAMPEPAPAELVEAADLL